MCSVNRRNDKAPTEAQAGGSQGKKMLKTKNEISKNRSWMKEKNVLTMAVIRTSKRTASHPR